MTRIKLTSRGLIALCAALFASSLALLPVHARVESAEFESITGRGSLSIDGNRKKLSRARIKLEEDGALSLYVRAQGEDDDAVLKGKWRGLSSGARLTISRAFARDAEGKGLVALRPAPTDDEPGRVALTSLKISGSANGRRFTLSFVPRTSSSSRYGLARYTDGDDRDDEDEDDIDDDDVDAIDDDADDRDDEPEEVGGKNDVPTDIDGVEPFEATNKGKGQIGHLNRLREFSSTTVEVGGERVSITFNAAGSQYRLSGKRTGLSERTLRLHMDRIEVDGQAEAIDALGTIELSRGNRDFQSFRVRGSWRKAAFEARFPW